jgi:histone H1/5
MHNTQDSVGPQNFLAGAFANGMVWPFLNPEMRMAAKKSAAKKPAAKKSAAKKPAAKKAPAKKPAAKKPAAKKAPAKKPAAKKAPAKKQSAAARQADRARVSNQGHELTYVAKKHGVAESVVLNAIKKVGNMRVDVEAAIADFKKRSKAADKAMISREPHEIAYLAKKFNISTEKALEVVVAHGPSRKKVEAALKN